MTSISREQLKKQMDAGKDFVLIDALPEEYFKKGHLPHALSMPADKIEELATKRLQNKDQMIVTYCASAKCPKSKEAAEKLTKMGYKNVVEYTDGIEDWKAAGLPLETNALGEDAYGSGKVDKKMIN